jgi:hypothetical protein
MVRAKMKVTNVTHRSSNYGAGPQDSCDVELSAVQGEQNKTWAKWTPGGTIKLNITNPEAYNQFKAGEMYFVDFSPAPATEAEEK